MNFLTLTPLECSLLIGLGAFFLIQLLYYVILYNRLHRQSVAEKKGRIKYADTYAPLSVIISAKDAAGWLRTNLPAVLKQDYPCYEVIVINDGSVDDTEEVLKLLENEYPHLYHTFTPEATRHVSRKKLSLTLGIRAAKYDWLVFTEPNCYPVSNDWLKSLARNFTPGTDIVLGYSNYTKEKGWFNRKIMFDLLFQSMRFLGCALLKRPYMGMGSNMAYRKELYFRDRGYSSHLYLQRGEDDLFINQMATSTNTRVECSAASVVRILAPTYEKTWVEDKIGHVATGHLYKGLQRLMMGLESGSRYVFLLGCFALCLHAVYYQHWLVGGIALLLWVVRYVCQLLTFRSISVELGERRYAASLLLFDFLQPLWDIRYKLLWLFRRKSEFMRR